MTAVEVRERSTELTNSVPLSDWMILGKPKSVQSTKRVRATVGVLGGVEERRTARGKGESKERDQGKREQKKRKRENEKRRAKEKGQERERT